MKEIASVTTTILDSPPSCIAFCSGSDEYFIVGTYHLHRSSPPRNVENVNDPQGSQQRSGSLLLYRLQEEQLHQVQQCPVETAAILDICFLPLKPCPERESRDADGHPLLIAATSTGSLLVYDYNVSNASPRLTRLQEMQIQESGVLIMSLSAHPTLSNILGLTTSTGAVSVHRLRGTSDLSDPSYAAQTLLQLPPHSLECFRMSFVTNSTTVFSGGDDAVLQCSSVPSILSMDCSDHDEQGVIDASANWADRTMHDAGVTAILSLTSDVIVTGSYDDHVRVVQAPSAGRRRILSHLKLGGGVWSLKIVASDVERGVWSILASCMYAGARVLQVRRIPSGGEEGWTVNVLVSFTEHESMNYASEIVPGCPVEKQRVLSTSFYDRRLCLWEVDVSQHAVR